MGGLDLVPLFVKKVILYKIPEHFFRTRGGPVRWMEFVTSMPEADLREREGICMK